MNSLFNEKELNQEKILESFVKQDEITKEISNSFDFEFDGKVSFTMTRFKRPENDFNVGLVVGPSGSGKSNILKEFNKEENIQWDSNKAVCSHFATHDEAVDKLSAVGFNSIPSWLKPYHVFLLFCCIHSGYYQYFYNPFPFVRKLYLQLHQLNLMLL